MPRLSRKHISKFHDYCKKEKKVDLVRLHTLDEYLEIDKNLITLGKAKKAKSLKRLKNGSTLLANVNDDTDETQTSHKRSESSNHPIKTVMPSDIESETNDGSKTVPILSRNKLVMELSDELHINVKDCRSVDHLGQVTLERKKEEEQSAEMVTKEKLNTDEDEKSQSVVRKEVPVNKDSTSLNLDEDTKGKVTLRPLETLFQHSSTHPTNNSSRLPFLITEVSTLVRNVDCVNEVALTNNKDQEQNITLVTKEKMPIGDDSSILNSNRKMDRKVRLKNLEALYQSCVKNPIKNFSKKFLPTFATKKPTQVTHVTRPTIKPDLREIRINNIQQGILKLNHHAALPSPTLPLQTTSVEKTSNDFNPHKSTISKNVLSHISAIGGQALIDQGKPFVIRLKPIGSEASLKRLCSSKKDDPSKINLTDSSPVRVQSVPNADFVKLVKTEASKPYGRTTHRPNNQRTQNIKLERIEKVFPVALKSSESQDLKLIETDNIDGDNEILGV
ncbi:hypothetical protein QAD02_008916 [Eretmocerus hayati]|uniref:Uncharacterized protein n=1 Tax=Eretmocerus hayati TaxID=131215 RepID=A0ACC2N7R7_9HYME|nr:hypothetical protein QAD02_008916 [Eretmocerus hayati]